MKKIKMMNVAAAVSAALMAFSFVSCGKKDNFVFKVGTGNASLCWAPLHIAIDNGYFDEEFKAANAKYEIVEIDSVQAAQLTAAGKIDGSAALAGNLIPMMDSGLEVSFVTGMHTGCTKYYVRQDFDFKSLADLKGKKIGFPAVTDSSVIAFQRKFYDLGFKVSGPDADFELVVYNMPDLPLALQNGAVDAIGVHDPIATVAEKEYNLKKVLDLTEDEKFSTEYCCGAFVSTDVARKHPEAAAAFTRAIIKASAFVQAEPKEAAQLQIDNTQMSGDVELNGYLLGTYNYTPSVKIMKQTLIDSVHELVRIGVLKNVDDENQFIENHFASFDNVPDSLVYNADGTFSEKEVTSLTAFYNKPNPDDLIALLSGLSDCCQ